MKEAQADNREKKADKKHAQSFASRTRTRERERKRKTRKWRRERERVSQGVSGRDMLFTQTVRTPRGGQRQKLSQTQVHVTRVNIT